MMPMTPEELADKMFTSYSNSPSIIGNIAMLEALKVVLSSIKSGEVVEVNQVVMDGWVDFKVKLTPAFEGFLKGDKQ